MSWSDLTKVLGGVLIAIALLIGGSFLAAQYLIAQFTALPPKPIFPNDSPGAKARLQSAAATKPVAISPSPQPSASVLSPGASPTPSPKPSDAAGYRARITLSQGLNLRESPSRDAARVGGVDRNSSITVLEESPDHQWQRIRLESSGQEGWVKAGYTERVNQ